MIPYLNVLYSELRLSRCKDTKYFFIGKENIRKSFFEKINSVEKVVFGRKYRVNMSRVRE